LGQQPTIQRQLLYAGRNRVCEDRRGNHRPGTKPVLPTTGSFQGRGVEVGDKVEARHRAGTSAVTPEAFHDHCEKGRAAEVAAALEAVRGDPERLRALLEHREPLGWTPLHRVRGR